MLYNYALDYYITVGVGSVAAGSFLLLLGIALWGLYCSLRPHPTNHESCRCYD